MSIQHIRLGLLVAGLVTAAGCGHKEDKVRHVERWPSLETVEPTRTVLPLRIELAATVEPLERADLCARIPGVVAYLPLDIDIGRRVTANEKLVELAVPELEAQKQHKEALLDQAQRQELLAQESLKVAQKEIEEAEKQEKRYAADHAFAKSQYDRLTALVRRDTVTVERGQEAQRQLESAEAAWLAIRAQVETKKAKLEAGRADLLVARSRVDVARAEVNNLAKLIVFATIRAPFDGVITKRWVDRGATIKDAGAPLLTVMNTDTVRVLMDIPERHVPLVSAIGQQAPAPNQRDPVELRIPALREVAEGGEFRGTLTRIAAAIDPNTRTMRAEMHIANRDGHLKPGMYGTARILLAERSYVLTVPSTALVRRGDEIGVYGVDELNEQTGQGVVKWLKIDLGLDDGVRVEVRKGLTGREQLIAKGNGVVREGDTVIAKPAREREQ